MIAWLQKGEEMRRRFGLLALLAAALAVTGCEKVSTNSGNETKATEETPSGYSKAGGETVNGYVLPPYPDQALNDSTLLGIDSNNNGVRDDVERWLIFKYKDHHRIVTEIGFQAGRAHQFMLANPDKPEEARQKINGAQSCNFHFQYEADEYDGLVLIDHDISTSNAFKAMQFNTGQRIREYFAYDKKLSGGVYRMPSPSEEKAFCAFDIDKMLKEQK
jgi:hypothetical protein